MSVSAIRAARAFVELSVEKAILGRDLRVVRSMVQGALDDLQAIGSRTTLFGGAAAASFLPFVKSASDAQETLNKFNQVFGIQSRAANQFAADLANNTGRSIDDVRDSLAAFNALFVGLGFDPTSAREMSQQLSALAVDFASFNNLADDKAIERFISAMSGSSEVVARFGINLKQAAVEQQLLSLGLADSMASATEADKTLARLAIITESLTSQGAAGDAVRTADQFANSLRSVGSQAERLSRAIGAALLPALESVLPAVRDTFGAFAQFLEQNPALTRAVAALSIAVTGLGAALLGLAVAGKTLVFLVGALSSLSLAVNAFRIMTGGVPALLAFFQGIAQTGRAFVSVLGGIIPRLAGLAAGLKSFAAFGVKAAGFLGRLAGIAGLAYGVFLLADAFGLAGKQAQSLASQTEQLQRVQQAGRAIAEANAARRAESPQEAASRLQELPGMIATRQSLIADLVAMVERARAEGDQATADELLDLIGIHEETLTALREERDKMQAVVDEANKPAEGRPEEFERRRLQLLDDQAVAIGRITEAQRQYNELLRDGYNEQQAQALAILDEQLRAIDEQQRAEQALQDFQTRRVELLEREKVLRGTMTEEQARINQLVREGMTLAQAQQIAAIEGRISGLQQPPMAARMADRRVSDRGQGISAADAKFFTFPKSVEDVQRRQLEQQRLMREHLQRIADASDDTDPSFTI